MELKDLPFKIGMQYENWEFDLELVETKKNYEIYEYIKGDITQIDNEKVVYIHLCFQLDILFKIKIQVLTNLYILT